MATSFSFGENPQIELVGKAVEAGQKHEAYDEIFGMNLVKFSGESTYTQRIKIKSATTLSGFLTFMTCDNEKCLPPMDVEFQVVLK